MLYKNYLVVLPGIILAFVLYTLSQGFNNIIGIELLGHTKSPISTAMIAILLGIFFGNFFKIRESFQKGLDFSREMNLSEAGDKLIETTLRVANGRLTCAEALGHKEFVMTKLYRSA